jgi:hypothetical protein
MSFPLPAVPPNTYHLPSTTCRRHPLRLPTSSYLAIARGVSHSSSDSRHALRQVRLYSCSKQCVWVWMNISASLGRREPSLWSAVWACRLGSAVSRRTSFPDIPTVLAPTSRNFSRIDVSRAETSACPSSAKSGSCACGPRLQLLSEHRGATPSKGWDFVLRPLCADTA